MKTEDYIKMGHLFDELIHSSKTLDDKELGALEFNKIHTLINECGYSVQAEQRGISGTFLYLVPIE